MTSRALLTRAFTVLMFTLVLTSCAHQPVTHTPDPPGFIMGFVHGLISLFSLIGSIFWDIRVYAFLNSGGWYDLGFVLGAGLFYSAGTHGTEKYYQLGYEQGVADAKLEAELEHQDEHQ